MFLSYGFYLQTTIHFPYDILSHYRYITCMRPALKHESINGVKFAKIFGPFHTVDSDDFHGLYPLPDIARR